MVMGEIGWLSKKCNGFKNISHSAGGPFLIGLTREMLNLIIFGFYMFGNKLYLTLFSITVS